MFTVLVRHLWKAIADLTEYIRYINDRAFRNFKPYQRSNLTRRLPKSGMNILKHGALGKNLISIHEGKIVAFGKNLLMILYIVDSMSENSVLSNRPVKSVCKLGGLIKANCTAISKSIRFVNGVKKTDIGPPITTTPTTADRIYLAISWISPLPFYITSMSRLTARLSWLWTSLLSNMIGYVLK